MEDLIVLDPHGDVFLIFDRNTRGLEFPARVPAEIEPSAVALDLDEGEVAAAVVSEEAPIDEVITVLEEAAEEAPIDEIITVLEEAAEEAPIDEVIAVLEEAAEDPPIEAEVPIQEPTAELPVEDEIPPAAGAADLGPIEEEHIVVSELEDRSLESLQREEVLQPATDVEDHGEVGGTFNKQLDNDSKNSDLFGAYSASTGTNESSVRLHVSSKHLALASRVFNVMFYGTFLENDRLGHRLGRGVPLPDDQLEPFIILMNIIHGRTRQVPRQVDPEMLFAISILVNKYECHEAVEMFTDNWFDRVSNQIPDEDGPALAHWTFMCWVFRKGHEFKRLTRIAQRHCVQPFKHSEVPLPESISDKLEEKRFMAISSCCLELEEMLQRYEGLEQLCRRQTHCDEMVLGGLIRLLQSIGIHPFPQRIPDTLIVDEIVQKLNGRVTPSLCEYLSAHGLGIYSKRRYSYDSFSGWTCGITQELRRIANRLEADTDGLDLNGP